MPTSLLNTFTLPSQRDECEKLLTSSAFADCHSRLNLEMYIQACMQDKCSCKGNEDSFCLCSTISEYSRQCSHAGGRPGEWRTENFCCKQLYTFYKEIFPGCSTVKQLNKLFVYQVTGICHELHTSSAIHNVLCSFCFLLLPLLLRNLFQLVEIMFLLKSLRSDAVGKTIHKQKEKQQQQTNKQGKQFRNSKILRIFCKIEPGLGHHLCEVSGSFHIHFFQTRHVLATWSIEKAAHPAWILAHTWKSAAFVRNITWMAVSALKASVFLVLVCIYVCIVFTCL